MREKLTQNFDIVAVICLAVVPAFVSCLAPTQEGAIEDYSQSWILYDHLWLLTASVQVSLPILLIMQLKRVDWKEFGFVKFRAFTDVGIALMLTVGAVALFELSSRLLEASGVQIDSSNEAIERVIAGSQLEHRFGWIPVLISSIANGFAEELALRSYLLVRLRRVSGSSIVAVVATTVLFSSYHMYQGILGVAGTLAMGLLFGAYVSKYRRFWPVAIAHMFLDFWASTQVLEP